MLHLDINGKYHRHKKGHFKSSAQFYTGLVPGAGIEPARIAARDFESRASTNSATRAFWNIHYCIIAIPLL